MMIHAAMVILLQIFLTGLLYVRPLVSATSTSNTNSLGSDVTILFQNDLLGASSPVVNSGALLLSNVSRTSALSACSELGESVWSPEQKSAGSLKSSLDYLVYEGKYPASQEYQIAASGSQCRTLGFNATVHNVDCFGINDLPALCTHTAPLSNSTYQNTSSQWQVQVRSNNEYVTGFRDRVSFRFLGVRYASQPQRFTYSKPYQGKNGNVSALSYGSWCVQKGENGTEDCLFLNIWTPFLPANGSASRNGLKPVMFYIHGGNFSTGSGSVTLYDGGNLASRGDVVVVNINYRLTTLGFLALNDGVTNGNYGFADQIVALDWVQANIRSFGGDPNKITVMGQSAGASAVRALLASPKSIGKFAAAIPQSNAGGSNIAFIDSLYHTIPEEVKISGNPILIATGCIDATSHLECLRAYDAQALVELSTVANYFVVDGTYLTANELILNGSALVAHVHLLMGFTRDDGGRFVTYPNATESLSQSLTANGFPADHIIASGDFPEPSGSNKTLDIFNVTSRVASNAEFQCVNLATVYAGVQHGLFKTVWFYEFNRSYAPPDFSAGGLCDAPADAAHPNGNPDLEYFKCHGGDLYYTFGTVLREGISLRDSNDLPFEQFVVDSWAAFGRNYDPNPDPGFPEVRGYVNTTAELKTAGQWEPVVRGKFTLREMQWPSLQIEFPYGLQCSVVGFPLDYFA